LPILDRRAHSWPVPRPIPPAKVKPMSFPLESISYVFYLSPDAQTWHARIGVAMSPRYPWTASDMMILIFRGYDANGVLVYETGRHAAEPPWCAPGETTWIEWDAPVSEVGRQVTGFWCLLRWR